MLCAAPLIGLLTLASAVGAQNGEDTDRNGTSIWEEIIPPNEGFKTPPMVGRKPVEVFTDISIFSLRVREEQMQIVAEMYINVHWQDSRLRYPNETYNHSLVVPEEYKEKIWLPSLYFYNEQDAKEMLLKIPTLKYFKDKLEYKIRYSAKLTCEFIYYDFPMDVQECYIQLQSFHESTAQVLLKYVHSKRHFPKNKFPPQFYINKEVDVFVPRKTCTEDVNGSDRSCIQIYIKMERLTGFHSVQMFVPSILIVIVSWISFWISVEAVPARIGLGITSMLTLVTQFSKSQSALPPVSYVKAIDIWMVVCLVMVFCSIIEFAFAYCLHYHRKAEAAKKPKRPRQIHPVAEGGRQKTATTQLDEEPEIIASSFSFDKFQKVDKVSRFLFPLIFLLFIICFWSKYPSDRNDSY